MPRETTQPHYQHHVESSSQVESFQQKTFHSPGVHPTQLFDDKSQILVIFNIKIHTLMSINC